MIGGLKTALLIIPFVLTACAAADQGDPIVIQGIAVPPLPVLDSESVEAGGKLYAEYCASCHGANLEGESNWQQPKADGSLPAPPHDENGHTWHHPDEVLIETITEGGDPAFGGTMPGFGDQLSREEMVSILDFIKNHWRIEDREFQWWISSR